MDLTFGTVYKDAHRLAIVKVLALHTGYDVKALLQNARLVQVVRACEGYPHVFTATRLHNAEVT